MLYHIIYMTHFIWPISYGPFNMVHFIWAILYGSYHMVNRSNIILSIWYWRDSWIWKFENPVLKNSWKERFFLVVSHSKCQSVLSVGEFSQSKNRQKKFHWLPHNNLNFISWLLMLRTIYDANLTVHLSFPWQIDWFSTS